MLEEISEEIHNMWTIWATEILETEIEISSTRKKGWEEECFKPYAELTENMKNLDRKYAIRILDRINSTVD